MLVSRGTKGGRHRLSPIVGSKEEVDLVISLCKNANGKIFKRVPSKMDVHSFRAEYAKRVYNSCKRNFSVYKNERMIILNKKIISTYTTKNGRKSVAKLRKLCKEKGISPDAKGLKDLTSAYYCRNDMKGVVYDKLALHKASLALGHNRINVIAEHYLIN